MVRISHLIRPKGANNGARFCCHGTNWCQAGVIAVQTLGQAGFKSVKIIMFEDVRAVSRYKLVRSHFLVTAAKFTGWQMRVSGFKASRNSLCPLASRIYYEASERRRKKVIRLQNLNWFLKKGKKKKERSGP